jgi:hypothetical protein
MAKPRCAEHPDVKPKGMGIIDGRKAWMCPRCAQTKLSWALLREVVCLGCKDRGDRVHHCEGKACPCGECQPTPAKKRSCNRHDDCDAADALAKSKGRSTDHCHDSCCEDCFGQ